MNDLHQRRRYRCNKRAGISHRSTFAGGRAFRWFLVGVVPTRRTHQPSSIISRWERRIRSNPHGLSGSRNRSGLWVSFPSVAPSLATFACPEHAWTRFDSGEQPSRGATFLSSFCPVPRMQPVRRFKPSCFGCSPSHRRWTYLLRTRRVPRQPFDLSSSFYRPLSKLLARLRTLTPSCVFRSVGFKSSTRIAGPFHGLRYFTVISFARFSFWFFLLRLLPLFLNFCVFRWLINALYIHTRILYQTTDAYDRM